MTEGEAGASKLDEVDDEEPAERVEGRQDVLWEVGSVSDASDTEEKERKGVGGGNSRGERRGLLVDEEEDGEAVDRAGSSKVPAEEGGNPFADEEGFGDYEGVAREELPSLSSLEKT